MALVLKDRVKESTTTAGTGPLALGGAVTDFQTFAAIGNGNTTYYTVAGGTDWEVGIGTYNAAGPSISRDTIISSSNNGLIVNLAAGTKYVFCTWPASVAASAVSDSQAAAAAAAASAAQAQTNANLILTGY